MPEHPCARGLTKECFREYPEWARQALAYKLLHILLPHQLSQRLRIGFFRGFFQFPPGWEGWLDWCLSQGLDPSEALPPDWPEGQPPPETFPTGYDDGVVDPDTGAVPPVYVEPFEPGPPHPYYGLPAPSFDIGSLLITQATAAQPKSWRNGEYYMGIAMAIVTMGDYKIHAVDLKVGKENDPDDSVHLEIWRAGSDWKPINQVSGGISTSILGSSLPDFSLGQDYQRFLFKSTPELFIDQRYDIFITAGDLYDAMNFYKIAQGTSPERNYYWKFQDGTWYKQIGGAFHFKIYGETT